MTADYTTLATMLAYRATTSPDSNDDAVITSLITRMSRLFDTLTERQAGAYAVEGTPPTYRYFNGHGRRQVWIDEAVTISEVATSTDGMAFTVWDGADVWTLDGEQYANIPIRLLQIASDSAKTAFDAGERGVRVEAVWGYSRTAPDDVEQAVVRLVDWAYELRAGSSGQNSPIVTDVGVVLPPGALPDDVMAIVRRYREEVFKWAS